MILTLLTIASCAGSKKKKEAYKFGLVSSMYKAENCSYVILEGKKGEGAILTPHNLPSEFQKDGIKVKFKYHPVRVKNKEGCIKGKAVYLDEIKLK